MNWLLILLVIDTSGGNLQVQNHAERVYPNEQACNTAGTDLTTNVQYPNNLKGTYLCIPQSVFAEDKPDLPKRGILKGIL